MAKKSKRVIDLENRVSELEAKLADTEAKLAATEQQLRNTEQELLAAMAPKAPTAPKAAATPQAGSRQERDAEVTRLASERGLEARRVGLNTWEILNTCEVAGKLDYWQNRQEWTASGGKLAQKHTGTLESLLDLLAYPGPQPEQPSEPEDDEMMVLTAKPPSA
jgi:hypothetical protein